MGCYDCPNVNEAIPCPIPSLQCNRGQFLYYDGRSKSYYCDSCQSGSYCPTGNEVAIYSSNGQTISQGYITCPSGLTTTRSNAVACTRSGSSECPYGTEKLASGEGCYLCPAGKYQDGTMLRCEPCPGNSVSDVGASICTSTCVFGARDRNGGLGVCRYVLIYYNIIILLAYYLNASNLLLSM